MTPRTLTPRTLLASVLVGCIALAACGTSGGDTLEIAASDNEIDGPVADDSSEVASAEQTGAPGFTSPVDARNAVPARRLTPPTAPTANQQRPEVYLAFYGSEGLLGADNQWTYARSNLDGLWGNRFGGADSIDKAVALTRSVGTLDLVVEHPITLGGGCVGFTDDGYWQAVENVGGFTFDRQGMSIYAAENPNCWANVGGVTGARNHYAPQGYSEIETLYQPQNLTNSVNAASFPTIGSGSPGEASLYSGDRIGIECPLDVCAGVGYADGFYRAMNIARERGVPFTWFTGYSDSYGIGKRGWMGRVQNMYNNVTFRGLWRAGDRIVVINYDNYPALPERNGDGSFADTTSGILGWLLTQRPIR